MSLDNSLNPQNIPRVDHNVNHGLCIVFCGLYQCGVINCNTCTTLGADIGNGGHYACWGAGSIREISVLSPKFAVDLRLL